MAGSDPFKTGNMAFRLGLAKVLVPFVFVFSPSLLLVAKGFTWPDFIITFVGCIFGCIFGCTFGITLLAAALSKFLFVEMNRWEQLLCGVGALLLVAPGLASGRVGLAVAAPVLLRQWSARGAARSLSDLGSVGCESTAAVHFSPSFCPMAGPWGCKSGKNCPRWGRFSLSTPQVRQAPSGPGAPRPAR